MVSGIFEAGEGTSGAETHDSHLQQIIPEENRKEICKYLFQGVSNCYVFKSRLQEYAQKVGFPTPVYETIKEGPSHEPSFRSTVIVNDVRYDSLPGFSNRKAAEQSAAEVALVELSKSGEVNHSISVPVHETGLCKNLLQEYAQKMNFAIPLYQCQKEETPGRTAYFSCTVEIGGIRYIGTCAKTKKEAEIKAARTALLAIQSSTSQNLEKQDGYSNLTVIPFRKRTLESVVKAEDNNIKQKFKKVRFQKKMMKKKRKTGDRTGSFQRKTLGSMEIHTTETDELGFKPTLSNFVDQGVEFEPLADVSLHNLQSMRPCDVTRGKETFATNVIAALHGDSNVEDGGLNVPDAKESHMLAPVVDTPSMVHVDTRDTGTGEVDEHRIGEINFEPVDSCGGELLC